MATLTRRRPVRRSHSALALTTNAGNITDKTRGNGTTLLRDDGLTNDFSTGIYHVNDTSGIDNHVTNGGFTTNTTGWTAYSANATIARVTTQQKFGTASLEVVCAGVGVGEGCAFGAMSVTESLPYTASIWVKAPLNATLTLEIVERLVADAVDVGVTNANFTGTGDWQRVTVTRTFGVGGVVARIRIYTITSVQAITFYVDGVQLEQSRFAVPYLESDGAVSASSYSEVYIPTAYAKGIFTTRQGWVAVRARMGWDSADIWNTKAHFCSFNSSTSNFIDLYATSTQVVLGNDATAGAAADTVGQNKTWARGQVITVIGAWTPSNLYVSADGAAFTALGSRAEIPSLLTNHLRFGYRSLGSNFELNGDILWAAMGSGTLTDADAAKIHAFGNNKPDWFQLPGHPTGFWDGIRPVLTKIHG